MPGTCPVGVGFSADEWTMRLMVLYSATSGSGLCFLTLRSGHS